MKESLIGEKMSNMMETKKLQFDSNVMMSWEPA